MALTLPDICAALEAENGRTHPDKYKAWYRQHLAAYYPQLTDEDCYELRCGVVHQGRFGRRPDNPKLQYARVLFSLPSPTGGVVVSFVAADVLNLDAIMFCHRMVDAVRTWYLAKKEDPNVIAHLPL